ncbi:MAG: hypothetical protein FWG30_11520 [Eubacteriaceae bacterium]|nr:hypothetical protein [Eubacteriaceae bacterium]
MLEDPAHDDKTEYDPALLESLGAEDFSEADIDSIFDQHTSMYRQFFRYESQWE